MPVEAGGLRLDSWLARQLGPQSRAEAQRLIESGRVRVDGRRRGKGHRLAGGERVSMDTEPPHVPPAPIAAEPRVAWEDQELVIVDKPAGVVVHPAPGHRAVTLVEWLEARAGGEWRPLVVHRLDRDTSGLMVVAKTDRAQAFLRLALRRRELEREYVALVKGQPGSLEGAIEAPLGRDPRRRTRMSTATDKPRQARTNFAVERRLGRFTLLRVSLETGRTHQIRAHLAAIGTPVCGDREYGGRGVLGLERQFLHSARIAFPHPQGGASVECRSELPSDLADALGRAEREATTS